MRHLYSLERIGSVAAGYTGAVVVACSEASARRVAAHELDCADFTEPAEFVVTARTESAAGASAVLSYTRAAV